MEKKINEAQLLIDRAVHSPCEDTLALSSPGYLKSIQEARKNFREGKIKTVEDVFNV